MPDIEEQIEQKYDEYRKVSEKIASDEFEDYEKEKRNSLKEKRDNLYSRITDLNEQKEQRDQLSTSSSSNEPIKPDPEKESEIQEKMEQADEARSEDHYHHAFYEYAKKGLSQMNKEDRDKLYQGRDVEIEHRAQVTEDDTLGGFLVPEEMEDQIIEARKQFGGMRQANTTQITTDSGGSLPIPTLDDTSNKGEYIGEDTEVSEQTMSLGEVVLESHILSSKKVPVSMALLQDSAVDLDGLLGEMLGTRIGRRENEAFTTGTGSNEPHGILTAATEGHEASDGTGSDTDIVEEDLIDLKHSVDPAYRNNAQWMMNDAILQNLKKTQDSDGQPIFMENYRDGEENFQIDGDPVIINQDMTSTITADDKTVLYGDFSRYWIRDVEGITLRRLDEVQATRLNVVFLAFTRNDGNLADAGQNPVKYLKQ